jgi:hypothetical protein
MNNLNEHELRAGETGPAHRYHRRGLHTLIAAAVAMGIPLATTALFSASAAGAKAPNKSHVAASAPTAPATASVSPSVVTWGASGNDVITVTASGLTPGATYYEQVQSLDPAGVAITVIISFAATSTGGIPAPWNSWEMNDPYNASQNPPPTFSGPAEVVITSSSTVNGISLSGTPVATTPFTILPGQNSLVS